MSSSVCLIWLSILIYNVIKHGGPSKKLSTISTLIQPSAYIKFHVTVPAVFLTTMEEIFAERTLHYSRTKTLEKTLSVKQMTFLDKLKEALPSFIEKEDWDRTVVNGAAFLFWTCGISDARDVRNVVAGMLRSSKRKDIRSKDCQQLAERVNIVIRAFLETFKDCTVGSKFVDAKENTNITASTLASWSTSDDLPLRSDGAHWERAAVMCLVYEPLRMAKEWNNLDIYLRYVRLYAGLRGENLTFSTPYQGDVEGFREQLKKYDGEFKLSEKPVDDVMMVEYSSETGHNTLSKNSGASLTGRKDKGMTKPVKRKKRHHTEPKDLIGDFYPSLNGKRIFVNVTEDGRPESVTQSQWKRYFKKGGGSTKEERKDWRKRYPRSLRSQKKEWMKMNKMSYDKYQMLKPKIAYRLLQSQRGTTMPVLALLEDERKMIKVDCTQRQYKELANLLNTVEEGDYKPKKTVRKEYFDEDEDDSSSDEEEEESSDEDEDKEESSDEDEEL